MKDKYYKNLMTYQMLIFTNEKMGTFIEQEIKELPHLSKMLEHQVVKRVKQICLKSSPSCKKLAEICFYGQRKGVGMYGSDLKIWSAMVLNEYNSDVDLTLKGD